MRHPDGRHDERRDGAPTMVDEHWERRPDGTAVRVLHEAVLGGRVCRVWLADTRETPGAHAECCLIFDTGDRMRRVWSVPEDWGRMPAAMLVALADAAPSRSVGLPLGEGPPRVAAELRAPDAH
jgi:hypothetical protein